MQLHVPPHCLKTQKPVSRGRETEHLCRQGSTNNLFNLIF